MMSAKSGGAETVPNPVAGAERRPSGLDDDGEPLPDYFGGLAARLSVATPPASLLVLHAGDGATPGAE